MKVDKFATNTDTLIKAVEEADQFDDILILYQKKKEYGGGQGYYHVGETTCGTLNWLLDRFKLHLLGAIDDKD